jgi:uncharacterized protein (AIM24 family)
MPPAAPPDYRRYAFSASPFSPAPPQVTYDCDCNCWRALCGGQGCVRQHLKGTGATFLAAGEL